jgi:hypothetical protein
MTYFDTVATSDGEARVLTKTRWWNIFVNPHTTLMPVDFRQLGRLGVVFYWSTSDPIILKTLHDSVVESLRESSLADIRLAIDMRESDVPLAAFASLVKIFHPSVTKYVRKIR